jgi:enterochelin esterase family protein
VAFIYRGEATAIAFPGDFNGWNPANGPAENLDGTDIWVREEVFPSDSRLDYKIVRNGTVWMLDPDNPRTQRSGFGDNSELPMPDYVPSPYVVRRAGVPTGAMTPGSLASTHLGYTVAYQVYTPAGYDGLDDLPVIYVTDGHEYADDLMGSMVIVLDNLIHEGLIQPIMAVFIDPRVGGQNLRAEQYIMNQDFVDFVALELVPAIDAAWDTSDDRLDRGILGTSLGGLNSAWFGLQATDTFHRIAIQSPAFHAGNGQIVNLYAAAPLLDIDIHMTWGTFYDFGPTTEQFQAVLDDKGYVYEHLTVNEGHSWGNWRALLDDVLIHFWPAE